MAGLALLEQWTRVVAVLVRSLLLVVEEVFLILVVAFQSIYLIDIALILVEFLHRLHWDFLIINFLEWSPIATKFLVTPFQIIVSIAA